jgi:hypothetical protein
MPDGFTKLEQLLPLAQIYVLEFFQTSLFLLHANTICLYSQLDPCGHLKKERPPIEAQVQKKGAGPLQLEQRIVPNKCLH